MKPDKKSTSTHSGLLKQGTLGFTSTKRTASAAGAKGKKPLKVGSITAPASKKRRSTESSASTGQDDSTSVSQDEDVHVIVPRKREQPAGKLVARTQEGLENTRGNDETTLESLDKSRKLLPHYVTVRDKMGNLNPIHSEAQTKIHHILRVFDLSSEYGPCVGVSRVERWERARALGLNPPTEVHDILLTREAREDTQYSQSVFYDQV